MHERLWGWLCRVWFTDAVQAAWTRPTAWVSSMSSQPRGTLLRNDHGPPNAAPVPTLPRWVRGTDVVTILLGVAALQAALFGGFQIPGLSITNPWRPLVFAVVLAGLRHALFRTAPMHERLWGWLCRVWFTDAVRAAWTRPTAWVSSMSSQPRGTLLRNDHGPPNAAPVPTLPRWVRGADVVTILLGVAALQAALFGGFQIPGLSITVAGLLSARARARPAGLVHRHGPAVWGMHRSRQRWPVTILRRYVFLAICMAATLLLNIPVVYQHYYYARYLLSEIVPYTLVVAISVAKRSRWRSLPGVLLSGASVSRHAARCPAATTASLVTLAASSVTLVSSSASRLYCTSRPGAAARRLVLRNRRSSGRQIIGFCAAVLCTAAVRLRYRAFLPHLLPDLRELAWGRLAARRRGLALLAVAGLWFEESEPAPYVGFWRGQPIRTLDQAGLGWSPSLWPSAS